MVEWTAPLHTWTVSFVRITSCTQKARRVKGRELLPLFSASSDDFLVAESFHQSEDGQSVSLLPAVTLPLQQPEASFCYTSRPDLRGLCGLPYRAQGEQANPRGTDLRPGLCTSAPGFKDICITYHFCVHWAPLFSRHSLLVEGMKALLLQNTQAT